MSPRQGAEGNLEALIDEGLEGTFPASDPVSPIARIGRPVNNTFAGSRRREAAIPGVPDHKAVTLDAAAEWDSKYGIFRVRIHGSPDFGSVVVLGSAPLPLTHLDRRENRSKSPLGVSLHDRLQCEVNNAIARGAHQVATGIMLMTHQEMNSL